ncbi:MAG: peptidoglycan-binding protein [Candidatus Omnitrophota bacterium]
MAIRFLLIAVFALVLSGCATTSSTTPNPLQGQVTDLTQRVQDQEKQITDLKYEIKELSSKPGSEPVEPSPVFKTSANVKSEPSKAEGRSANILRVNVNGRELQKALKAAGVYEGKIDGKLGAKTRAAVVAFQKAHSLKADGVVGQKTWNELKAGLDAASAVAPAASGDESK